MVISAFPTELGARQHGLQCDAFCKDRSRWLSGASGKWAEIFTPLSTKGPNSCFDQPEAAVAPAADLPPDSPREQVAHLRDRVETLPQPHGADLAGAGLAFGGADQEPLAPAERGLIEVGLDVLRRDMMVDADDGPSGR